MTRHGWLTAAVLVICALPGCGHEPVEPGVPGVPGERTLVASISAAPPGTPRPIAPTVTSGRDVLHEHLRRLTLLVNGRCSSAEADCQARARQVLATTQAIRTEIENDREPSRFQEAVRIIGQLDGLTPDSVTVPANQDRIFGVGAELQSWLAKNFVW